MDVSRHIGASFLKPADITEPRRAVIADVREGKYSNPDCEFQDGGVLTLNTTNMRVLANAWSTDTDLWLGKEVELYVGKTKFQDRQIDSVLVKPISEALTMAERPKPSTTTRQDLNDEIPF